MIIKQIGWCKENFIFPIILLNIDDRKALGVQEEESIWVKADGVKRIAVIGKQNKSHKGIAVNKLLAKLLHLKLGQEIELESLPN